MNLFNLFLNKNPKMNSMNSLFVIYLLFTFLFFTPILSMNKNLGRMTYHETGVGLYVQNLINSYSERIYNEDYQFFSDSYLDHYLGFNQEYNDYYNFIVHAQ